MVNRAELTDEEWQVLYGLLLLNERIYVGSEDKCKRFLNAVLWILRSGTQWRLLPASLGKWNSVFKRFSRWCEWDVWQSLHRGCSQHPDLQKVLIEPFLLNHHDLLSNLPVPHLHQYLLNIFPVAQSSIELNVYS